VVDQGPRRDLTPEDRVRVVASQPPPPAMHRRLSCSLTSESACCAGRGSF